MPGRLAGAASAGMLLLRYRAGGVLPGRRAWCGIFWFHAGSGASAVSPQVSFSSFVLVVYCLSCVSIFIYAGASRVRRCGLCRLAGHDLRCCPIVKSPDIICGCNQRTCGRCTAARSIRDDKGHAADTLKEKVRAGIVPKWACPKHELAALQTRLGRRSGPALPDAAEAEGGRARPRAPACCPRRVRWGAIPRPSGLV